MAARDEIAKEMEAFDHLVAEGLDPDEEAAPKA
jgi:hypothetical protein